jgi:hypothetical protein
MGIKGCWTCRGNQHQEPIKHPYERQWADFCLERKVRCDSHWPRCGNCTKSRRVCQGYGMQLSWPRDGDRKRAIISQDTPRTVNTLQSNVKGYLNSTCWDISLSEELENGRISGEKSPFDTLSSCLIPTAVNLPVARYLRTMKVPRPTYLSPAVMNREESHLLGFCM